MVLDGCECGLASFNQRDGITCVRAAVSQHPEAIELYSTRCINHGINVIQAPTVYVISL